jgi:hypothetical protein
MRGLAAGLFTFLLYFLIQGTLFHGVKVSRRALALVGIWLLLLPAYGLVYHWLPDDAAVWPEVWRAPSDLTTWFSGALLYFFLFMGYAQFFYMAESSVGVRTMIELSAEPERGRSMDDLTRKYRYEWMLQRRLDRMVHAGYLIRDGDWCLLTRRGRFVARLLSAGKGLLRLGPGG